MNKNDRGRLGHKFATNVLLLTAASALMRAIGVRFNVYLSSRLGTDGLGLFTLTMSVYSLAVTLATSAVGFASTRMVSEAIGGGKCELVRPKLRACLLYSLFFGTFAAILLLILSRPIAKFLFSDIRTLPSLRALALSLPFVSLTSALSGYFTAVRRVARSSAAGVIGMLFRIGVTVLLLEGATKRSLEGSCLSVCAAMTLSEMLTLLLSFLGYLIDRRRFEKGKGSGRRGLFRIALPMAFSSYVRSALTTLEHLLIPWGLRRGGATKGSALTIYGTVQGMALPVVMFPYALLTPFCSLLVPETAERRASGENDALVSSGARAISFVATFGVGCAGVLACFGGDIGRILCGSAEAGRYITLLAPLVPIMYMDTCIDSLLKGIDEQVYAMRVNLLDASLSVLIVLFLTPIWGIYGFIAEIYICELLNATLSAARLFKRLKLPIDPWRDLFFSTASIIFATTFTRAAFLLVGRSVIYSRVGLWTQICFAVIVYLTPIAIVKRIRTER